MAKIAVENVNVPGQITNVDADKYNAMRAAMMAVMSRTPMTVADIKMAARGVLQCQATKPMAFSKT